MDKFDKVFTAGNKARKRDDIGKLMRRFKIAFRKVIDYAADQKGKTIFQNATHKVPRFRANGIEHHHPAINGMPALSEDEKRGITRMITQLRCKLIGPQAKAYSNGNLKLKMERLKLRGVPPWRGVAPVNEEHSGEKAWRRKSALTALLDGDVRTLSCPLCNKKHSHTGKDLDHGLRWLRLRCANCRSIQETRRYRCNCGIKVEDCSTHRAQIYDKSEKKQM